jgi:hypothetical protein
MVYIDGVLLNITKPIFARIVDISATYCGTDSSLPYSQDPALAHVLSQIKPVYTLPSCLSLQRLWGLNPNYCPGKRGFKFVERFPVDDAIEIAVRASFRQQPQEFYAAGFQGLVKRWDKCLNLYGDYVEK